jgi:hypothetical protein
VVAGNPVERLRAVRETQALQRAVERLHGADHRLDVRQPEPVLVEDCEAPAHQLVVVGLVARRAAQRRDARALGDVDPDLGHENALQVEACDHVAGPKRRPSAVTTWRGASLAALRAEFLEPLAGFVRSSCSCVGTWMPRSTAGRLRRNDVDLLDRHRDALLRREDADAARVGGSLRVVKLHSAALAGASVPST